VHFEQGRDYQRAIHYLRQAGENAQRRSANAEAISLLTKALKLLQFLRQTPERLRQEVGLHIALGTSLVALKGYAAPQVEYTLLRAGELCQQIEDTRELIRVRQGLCDMHYNRAEFHTARSLAEQLLHLAHSSGESICLPGIHAALSRILFAIGEFELAQRYAAQGSTLYDPRQHSPYISHVAHDPGVNCLATQVRTLWHLGYPDQALRYSQKALALARKLYHPMSLTLALNSSVALHHWRGEWHAAQELGEELLALAQRQALPHWAGWGMMLRGLILARQDQQEAGITQMRQGFTALTTTGAKMGLTGLSCELAWAYGKAGRAAEGLPLLAEALVVADNTGEHFALAELYRLKGQLTLRQSGVRGPQSPAPST
jgi:predicted ATPase